MFVILVVSPQRHVNVSPHEVDEHLTVCSAQYLGQFLDREGVAERIDKDERGQSS
jgi:hypothetical protein